MPRGQYERKPRMTDNETATTVETSAPVNARQAQEKQERRRRRNGDLNPAVVMRLGLPDEVLSDNKDYSLRWVNDEGGRIQHLTTQDDYDVVEGVNERIVGTNADGSPLVARLLRKPKDYAEEDQKAKLEAINARESGILRQPQGSDPGNSYALPENSIKNKAYQP